MFDLETYHSALQTQWLGQNLTYFEELGSTNSYLKKISEDHISHGQLCLADYQFEGRGQYERSWETEAGQNLTFTIAFKPPSPGRFHVLALACARAAVAQIEASLDCEASIKWPNDVMVHGKKVAGLLTETVFNGNTFNRLLIGIGLNVNQDYFSDEIKDKATSLKRINGSTIERELFLSEYLSRVEYHYLHWHKQHDELLKSINQKIQGYGRWVRLQVNGQATGTEFKLLGINQAGELATVNKQGDLKSFSHEQIRVITD